MSMLDCTVNNFSCLASVVNRYQSSILAELLIYFKPWETFERAELQLLQFERTEVAILEDLTSWNYAIKFVEVFIFVKTQAVFVLAFAEPNL